jgi:hypothetical protein
MTTRQQLFASAVIGALLLAGCGKSSTGETPAPSGPPAAEPSGAAQPAAAVESPGAASEPNGPAEGAAAFSQKAASSPFAQADPALKESFNRALIAFQIADYPRAAGELRDLAADASLSPLQKQVVDDLLAQTLKLAPQLAATNSALASANAGATFPVPSADTAQLPGNVPDDPFSTADPSIRASFARARIAFDIGNYAAALPELASLATNAQLNWQQRYAVQSLLDKTPRASTLPPAR